MPRLSPISLGPLTITAPVVLAPMTGLTDLPLRNLVKRLGAGLTVTDAAIVGEDGPRSDIKLTPWPSDHRATLAEVSF